MLINSVLFVDNWCCLLTIVSGRLHTVISNMIIFTCVIRLLIVPIVPLYIWDSCHILNNVTQIWCVFDAAFWMHYLVHDSYLRFPNITSNYTAVRKNSASNQHLLDRKPFLNNQYCFTGPVYCKTDLSIRKTTQSIVLQDYNHIQVIFRDNALVISLAQGTSSGPGAWS